jgi:hypothetical protein
MFIELLDFYGRLLQQDKQALACSLFQDFFTKFTQAFEEFIVAWIRPGFCDPDTKKKVWEKMQQYLISDGEGSPLAKLKLLYKTRPGSGSLFLSELQDWACLSSFDRAKNSEFIVRLGDEVVEQYAYWQPPGEQLSIEALACKQFPAIGFLPSILDFLRFQVSQPRMFYEQSSMLQGGITNNTEGQCVMPKLHEIYKEYRERVLNGTIATKESADKFLAEYYSLNYSNPAYCTTLDGIFQEIRNSAYYKKLPDNSSGRPAFDTQFKMQ